MLIRATTVATTFLSAILICISLAARPGFADDDDVGRADILKVTAGDQTITILGRGFLPNAWSEDPAVTLGGVPLTVTSAVDTEIVAECPLDPQGIDPLCPDGDLLLVVMPDNGPREDDDEGSARVTYDLTLGGDLETLTQAVCDLQAKDGGPLLELCPRKLVFVSSGIYRPGTPYRPGSFSFNSVEDANAICQELATAASLPGKYLAWISDASSTPSTTFERSANAYVLVDDTVIAANWQDLTDRIILNPINVNEKGALVAKPVWTGTRSDGTTLNTSRAHCSSWLSNSVYSDGIVGRSYDKDFWTFASQGPCSNYFALYCFQQ